MSWPVLPHGFLGSQAATGDQDTYQIQRSLRFNSADGPYLTRPFSTPTNSSKWTMSMWVKRGSVGTTLYGLFGKTVSTSANFYLGFNSNDTMSWAFTNSLLLTTTQAFRDPSSWYHFVAVWDSANATASQRARIYVNGNEITSFSSDPRASVATSMDAWNTTNTSFLHAVGAISETASTVTNNFDGYLTEVNFIDGQALTPSSFGETDAITGRWKAKAYSGTYGTNGFYLNFSDNSGTTATTLGKDSAPISGTHTAANNWTPNNFSVSSGVGNDSLTDSPANYGTISTTLSADTYQISRSLRFNSADSAYLNRTPASAGNRKTWTWSGWVKRGKLGTTQSLFARYTANTGAGLLSFMFWNDDTLRLVSGSTDYRITTAKYRDVSSWYHLVCSVDTTNATANNRIRFYVNGSEVTSFSTTNNFNQNDDTQINENVAHYIGYYLASVEFDGYLTEINFIDGQALTPDSFGVRDASTYLWKPKAYTGTYGTNGFYLNFSDNSGTTATTLGKDQAGSNNWTPNNFSVTAGADNDSLLDSPTNNGTSGNYCTLNSLAYSEASVSFSEGNLRATVASGNMQVIGTMPFSGKTYIEYTALSSNNGQIVFSPDSNAGQTMYFNLTNRGIISNDGTSSVSGSVSFTINSGSLFSWTTNDIIGVAYDTATNVVILTKNGGSSVNITVNGIGASQVFPLYTNRTSASATTVLLNTGQRDFNAAAPSGFRALRDYNKIPVPTGGVVRGNYATLNPIDQSGSNAFSNGNLDLVLAAGASTVVSGSVGISSGKWYFEVTPTAMTLSAPLIGVADLGVQPSSRGYVNANGWYYYPSGLKYNNNTSSSYGASYSVNDVIGVALDMGIGSLTFYKNGFSQGIAFNSGLSGKVLAPAVNNGTNTGTQSFSFNFGQRPWAYDAPFGFLPLCTTLLPTPAIQKPSSYMDVVTYTGNGTSPRTISGFGFSPDLLWIKNRTDAYNHIVYDTVRGAGSDKGLSTNTTKAENNTDNTNYGYVSAFTSDGFSTVTGSIDFGLSNTNSKNYVAWAWDEAPIAGMDIVSYTGNGTNRTIAHNLGVAPKFVIVKRRDTGLSPWMIWHNNLTSGTYYLSFSTGQEASGPTRFTASPTSSVINVGTDGDLNASGGTYIAYLFAEVEGFSKFGSYTGNGSSDGPFVFTGMRSRFLMFKRTDSTGNWFIYDTARKTFNTMNEWLLANTSDVENSSSTWEIDIISNGFKIRNNGAFSNASGGTYIFCAFAESPFKYSRAR